MSKRPLISDKPFVKSLKRYFIQCILYVKIKKGYSTFFKVPIHIRSSFKIHF